MSVKVNIIEAISVVSLLCCAFPLSHYCSLKGIPIPRHFSGGEVDAYTNRSIFIVLSVLALSVYVFLSFCQIHPKLINIPFTSQVNLESVSIQIVRSVKMWSMLLFASLSNIIYFIAIGKIKNYNRVYLLVIITSLVFHISMILIKNKQS